ncbi:MAG: hypothetical protein IKI95_02325 [Clostridia bacterium]|nr:hypothetical protein [Clostridia bacterium]
MQSQNVATEPIKNNSEKPEKFERSCWIDTAKAFGIFLVFWATLYTLANGHLLIK